MERKEALIHFSGGLDSFLSTMKTIEDGYRAVLINYNNGAMAGMERIHQAYERLLKRYGEDRVRMWGYGMTAGYFKALRDEFYQMMPSDMVKFMPDLTIGQINCLTCRSAMYIFSVLVCQRENINTVVDGARRSQGFVLERDAMLDKYRQFFKDYGIELLTPVLDLETDWERDIAVMLRGMSATPNDSKCFLGVPISFESEDIMLKRDQEAVDIWENNLKPKCHKLVKYSENIMLDNRGEMF